MINRENHLCGGFHRTGPHPKRSGQDQGDNIRRKETGSGHI